MRVFLDTSSLLKLYHYEVGTDKLIAKLSHNIEVIYLSELAKLEFRSAIWKKTRTNEITVETARSSIDCFKDDYDKFQWVLLNSDVVEQADFLLMKYGAEGLRTLDAIQLSSALILKEQPEICFFTADNLLQIFFKQEGLVIG